MPHLDPAWQWQLTVVVWHDPSFGHRITFTTEHRGRGIFDAGQATWKGLGVPKEVFDAVRGRADAIIADHLVTRYGVADQLFPFSPGEEGPF